MQRSSANPSVRTSPPTLASIARATRRTGNARADLDGGSRRSRLLTGCALVRAGQYRGNSTRARSWKDLEKLVSFGPRPAGSDALEATRAVHRSRAHARSAFIRTARPFSSGNRPQRFEGQPPGWRKFPSRETCTPISTPRIRTAMTVILCTHFDTKLAKDRFVGAKRRRVGNRGVARARARAREGRTAHRDVPILVPGRARKR